MKKLVILVMSASLSLLGCDHAVDHHDVRAPEPPAGLRTATGDGFIELFWDANPEGDIAGYNVFRAAAYNGSYEPVGSTRTPYFVDRSVQNGMTCYYAVTAFDEDGNESELSRDVAYDIPRPEGYNVVLGDYRAVPSSAGYDFSQYTVVPYNSQFSDMWFENYSGDLYMDVSLDDTQIQDVGPTGSILDVSMAPADGWSTTHDVLLYPGHTYVVQTWDNHFAKFRVTAIEGSHVMFDWAYQLQEGTPLLKTAAASGETRQPVTVRRQ